MCTRDFKPPKEPFDFVHVVMALIILAIALFTFWGHFGYQKTLSGQ